MDKNERKIRELEGTIIGQIVMMESLVELLYKHDIISKSEFSDVVDGKIKLLEKSVKKQSKTDDPLKNPMFYGPHGDA